MWTGLLLAQVSLPSPEAVHNLRADPVAWFCVLLASVVALLFGLLNNAKNSTIKQLGKELAEGALREAGLHAKLAELQEAGARRAEQYAHDINEEKDDKLRAVLKAKEHEADAVAELNTELRSGTVEIANTVAALGRMFDSLEAQQVALALEKKPRAGRGPRPVPELPEVGR